MRFQCGLGYSAWGCRNRGWLGQKLWEIWKRFVCHVITSCLLRTQCNTGHHHHRDARLHVRSQIPLYRVCQERLLDFTMNWQRCRERVWACDSSDVHGPGRQPGSVLIATLPAPWLDRFPSHLIFHLSIDAAHLASSRPAPPRPLNIHTLAMRYFSTVPQALSAGYFLFLSLSPPLLLFSPALIFLSSFTTILQKAINSERSLSVHPSLSSLTAL